jgi:hypothetical protein
VDVARTSERERERERDKTGLGKHVMSNSVLSSKIQKITTSCHLDHQHQVDCYSRSTSALKVQRTGNFQSTEMWKWGARQTFSARM